jgi:hypothetical protein
VPIGRLAKGEIVKGITGVHITKKPDRIPVFQAIPELGLRPGDVILRCMYLGEGFANIWANGKCVKEIDCTLVSEKRGGGCLPGGRRGGRRKGVVGPSESILWQNRLDEGRQQLRRDGLPGFKLFFNRRLRELNAPADSVNRTGN